MNSQFGWCTQQEKTRELEEQLEIIYAFIATIKSEWNDIDTWMAHAIDMNGMPKDLTRVINLLKFYDNIEN